MVRDSTNDGLIESGGRREQNMVCETGIRCSAVPEQRWEGAGEEGGRSACLKSMFNWCLCEGAPPALGQCGPGRAWCLGKAGSREESML